MSGLSQVCQERCHTLIITRDTHKAEIFTNLFRQTHDKTDSILNIPAMNKNHKYVEKLILYPDTWLKPEQTGQ